MKRLMYGLLCLPGLCAYLTLSPPREHEALAPAVAATVLVTTDVGSGSGAIVAPNLVLTAMHVVALSEAEECAPFKITLSDGTKRAAELVSCSLTSDIALLQLSAPVDISPIRIATEPPEPLERVYQTGCALGRCGRVGVGFWARTRRTEILGEPMTLRSITGGFTWPGMSGGPVVDARGRLVGVTSAVETGGSDEEIIIPELGLAADYDDLVDFLRSTLHGAN